MNGVHYTVVKLARNLYCTGTLCSRGIRNGIGELYRSVRTAQRMPVRAAWTRHVRFPPRNVPLFQPPLSIALETQYLKLSSYNCNMGRRHPVPRRAGPNEPLGGRWRWAGGGWEWGGGRDILGFSHSWKKTRFCDRQLLRVVCKGGRYTHTIRASVHIYILSYIHTASTYIHTAIYTHGKHIHTYCNTYTL